MTEYYFLNKEVEQAWNGLDPFEAAKNVKGIVYRELEQRRTTEFQINNKSYFVKYHKGSTWKEIFKNIFQLRLPIVSANNEKRAIENLTLLGIKTPVLVGYGRRGFVPTNVESFIITENIGTQVNLENLAEQWQKQPPIFEVKKRMIEKVAEVSRKMHHKGICHRDFYICHLMVIDAEKSDIAVLDLHRALVKKNLGKRWIVKDVGSLYFSSMDFINEKKTLLRFMKHYSGKSLRNTLIEDKDFWEKVNQRALTLKNKNG